MLEFGRLFPPHRTAPICGVPKVQAMKHYSVPAKKESTIPYETRSRPNCNEVRLGAFIRRIKCSDPVKSRKDCRLCGTAVEGIRLSTGTTSTSRSQVMHQSSRLWEIGLKERPPTSLVGRVLNSFASPDCTYWHSPVLHCVLRSTCIKSTRLHEGSRVSLHHRHPIYVIFACP